MKLQNTFYLKGIIFAALTSLTLISQSSFASAQIACQNVAEVKDNINTSTCYQFVTGFLEGALLSDQQIMTNLGSSREMSDFTKRALRTRIGQDSKPISATYLADFCLPEEKATDGVVLTVLSALRDVEDKSRIDSTMIYLIVKREFPCA
jgi:hypothetical protein